jgi:hypothetical protein
MAGTTMSLTGSLRLVGATVAVAAGIAGFASAPAPVLVEAGASQQACDHASDRALTRAAGLASCTVVVDDGPVFGDPITDPIFGSPVVHGRR